MDNDLASKCYVHWFNQGLLSSLSATYTLIHAFLTKQLHTKAAQAVKRAAKEVVVLKDGIELEGPQLDEIIKQWTRKSASQKKESS